MKPKVRPTGLFRKLILFLLVVVVLVQSYILLSARGLGFMGKEKEVPCKQTDMVALKTCWIDTVTARIKKGDIEDAFTSLALLYDANPSMGETCHSLTHEIGQRAYTLFARNHDFQVSPKTAYCSYGFYHGFMEALVMDKGDMALARKFCSHVDAQLASITPDATLQCYHGIGHGTVNNHDPRTWGVEQAMIDPALALCEKVSEGQDQRSRCATGVFNGISIFYSTGEYKLVLKKDDPLWICREQKTEYQDACYISMNLLLLQLTDWDLARAARFIEVIPDTAMAQHTMINLASPIGSRNINESDHAAAIATCRLMQPRLHLACIQGYAFGFLEHGIPEQEYVKSLEFCKSKQIDNKEQNACFEYIFSYLNQWYSHEKAVRICDEIASDRKALCLEKIRISDK
jgi:hypothetical protein